MNSGSAHWQASPATLRSFGLIGLVAFALLGTWIHFRHALVLFAFSAPTASGIAVTLWCLASVMGLLAIIAPRWLLGVYVTMTLLAMPIGMVVSEVVLALLYFGVLTPCGLILRVVGRDPLRPTRGTPGSNWRERAQTTNVSRYYRQY